MDNAEHPSIERLADLQQFVADFSKITRVPVLADTAALKMTSTIAMLWP